MKIRSGETRYVLLTGNYAVKVPRLQLNIFKQIFSILKGRSSLEVKGRFLKIIFSEWIISNLESIKSNIREYKLGKKYPEIVMRTSLSIFGLINIQELGEVLSQEELDLLWRHLIDYANNVNNMVVEGHTFSEGFNFARNTKGEIKLIDAGSPTLEKTLFLEVRSILRAIGNL